MNRTEAARRDEILCARTAAWREGRCRHCEAAVVPPWRAWGKFRPGEITHYRIDHVERCPYPDSFRRAMEDLRGLWLQFGFPLDLTIQVQPGVTLVTRRRTSSEPWCATTRNTSGSEAFGGSSN